MNVMEIQDTQLIVFMPYDHDADEPTMPPHGPSEQTLEDLRSELESANGAWASCLVAAYGDAVRRKDKAR